MQIEVRHFTVAAQKLSLLWNIFFLDSSFYHNTGFYDFRAFLFIFIRFSSLPLLQIFPQLSLSSLYSGKNLHGQIPQTQPAIEFVFHNCCPPPLQTKAAEHNFSRPQYCTVHHSPWQRNMGCWNGKQLHNCSYCPPVACIERQIQFTCNTFQQGHGVLLDAF